MTLKYQSRFMNASARFNDADVATVIDLHAAALKYLQYGKPTKPFVAWAAGVVDGYSEIHDFVHAVETGQPWPPVSIEATAEPNVDTEKEGANAVVLSR